MAADGTLFRKQLVPSDAISATREQPKGLNVAVIIFADRASYERAIDVLDEIDDWVRVIQNPDTSDTRPWHLIADRYVPLLSRRFREEGIAYEVRQDGQLVAQTAGRPK